MFTGSSLERVKGLGDGETFATLQDMVKSDHLALDTLSQVPIYLSQHLHWYNLGCLKRCVMFVGSEYVCLWALRVI